MNKSCSKRKIARERQNSRSEKDIHDNKSREGEE